MILGPQDALFAAEAIETFLLLALPPDRRLRPHGDAAVGPVAGARKPHLASPRNPSRAGRCRWRATACRPCFWPITRPPAVTPRSPRSLMTTPTRWPSCAPAITWRSPRLPRRAPSSWPASATPPSSAISTALSKGLDMTGHSPCRRLSPLRHHGGDRASAAPRRNRSRQPLVSEIRRQGRQSGGGRCASQACLHAWRARWATTTLAALLRAHLQSEGVDADFVSDHCGNRLWHQCRLAGPCRGLRRHHRLGRQSADRPGGIAAPALWQDIGLLVLQNEVPEAVNLAAATEARARGLPVLLNAAPFRPLPADLLANVTHLIVNAVEAEMLGAPPVTSLAAASAAARQLSPLAANVIVTAGAQGLAAASGQGKQSLFRPKSSRTVSSHGAGDAFIGALAAALLRGADLACRGADRRPGRRPPCRRAARNLTRGALRHLSPAAPSGYPAPRTTSQRPNHDPTPAPRLRRRA